MTSTIHSPSADASQPADGEEWGTSPTWGQAGRSGAHQQATLLRSITMPHPTTHRRLRLNLTTTTQTTPLLRLRHTAPRTTITGADRTMLSSSSLQRLTSRQKIHRREDTSRCTRREISMGKVVYAETGLGLNGALAYMGMAYQQNEQGVIISRHCGC